MYFMAVNKFKPDINQAKAGKIIPLHIKWTREMLSGGKIVQAGKWGDSGGMAIFQAEDITDAEKILNEDPLIKSGLVTFELARLYPDRDFV